MSDNKIVNRIIVHKNVFSYDINKLYLFSCYKEVSIKRIRYKPNVVTMRRELMVMNDSAAWITLNLSMIITFLIL